MKDSLLQKVRRPIQYVNHEMNSIHKEGPGAKTRFALVFPDTYELGMSNQGLKILYDILNKREDVSAERVFAPENDMEDLLREGEEALATIESGTALRNCDIVGFTLQSELHYSNIVNMLDLGGVPLWSAERGVGDPFVLGGGPLALNPEPLADFFDAFVLGDGEEVVIEIVEAYTDWRNAGGSRKELLLSLAGIPGVYVPSLYHVSYAASGRIESVEPVSPGIPPAVSRRIQFDLDRCPVPQSPPVPYMETTHDRLTFEIARGCVRGCRFCHAGMTYRPYRERSPELVERSILRSLKATGYDEVSLSALSVGDYCHLVPLMKRLSGALKNERISISLPSMRPGSLKDTVIKDVGAVRKGGFTIAPEAGTDRLRKVINKGITEADILSTAEYVFKNGWKSLKLYFMIGLPTETEEDVKAILDLAVKVKRIAQRAGVRKPQVTVSVSPFVPKAHTPFQWFPMARHSYLKKVVDDFSRRCRKETIRFKWHNPDMALVESVLARGDRRLSKVICRVWKSGGKSEAWTDRFDLQRWLDSLSQENLDLDFYAHRSREEDEVLPWDHLKIAVSKKYLVEEYNRGIRGLETGPCQIGRCQACGACPPGENATVVKPSQLQPVTENPPIENRRFRLRLRFRKEGRMKYLSHLELFRTFYRASRRAGLILSFSEGFNPHPRILFAPPLPVGIEGENELVDIELASGYPEECLIRDMNHVLPEGLRITGARYFPRSEPALFGSIGAALIRVIIPEEMEIEGGEMSLRLKNLLGQKSLVMERIKGNQTKKKDVRPFIISAQVSKEDRRTCVDVWVRHDDSGTIRPVELLKVLFPDDPCSWAVPVRRLGLYRLVDGRPADAFVLPGPVQNKYC